MKNTEKGYQAGRRLVAWGLDTTSQLLRREAILRKKMRIIEEARKAKRDNPLGAARTAAIADILHKYMISDGQLRAMCLGHSGADYWT